MEHQDAIETYAAEGYLLDELTDEERNDFEQHFADCESCFADVRDGVRFIHALPEAVKEEEKHQPHGFRWPEMAAAASIAVALTAGIAQVAFIAPMRAQMAQMRAPHVAPDYRVSEGRGAANTIENGKLPWILAFDIVSEHPSPPYTCTIVDAHGKKWPSFPVTAKQAETRVKVPMAGGYLPAGDYSLIITGAGGAPVSTMEFTVR